VACRVDRRDRDLRQDLIQTPMGLIVAQSGADLPLQASARINRRPHPIPLTLQVGEPRRTRRARPRNDLT
jgi:hypothetical protein